MATLATSSASKLPRIILVEHLSRVNKVAKDTVCAHEVRVGPSWMDLIVTFLKDDIFPEEKSEAEKILRNATRFWLSEDHKLYMCSYSGSYLLCIHPEASEPLLEELHEGICGSHTRGRFLLHRALTQGYCGRECRKKLWNLLGNVTSARGLPQVSINREEFSTLCPAHGRSPSGA